ncbi:unnamed protein product [Calypogeia fissa]
MGKGFPSNCGRCCRATLTGVIINRSPKMKLQAFAKEWLRVFGTLESLGKLLSGTLYAAQLAATVHLSRYSNHIRRYRVMQQQIAFATPADDVALLRARLQEMKNLLRADLEELEPLSDACGDYLVLTIIYGPPFDALLTDFERVLTSDREAEGNK